jgi:hypothetical protein
LSSARHLDSSLPVVGLVYGHLLLPEKLVLDILLSDAVQYIG